MALADDLRYTLTVGQALVQFSHARRKIPSARSAQRNCIGGQIAAQKIRTTYGSEWLINEDALRRFIAAQPEIAAVASDAATTDMAAPATPGPQNGLVLAPVTIRSSAAAVASEPASESISTPEGERRSIAEVLIENARLLARVEGKDEIIAELKEDKNFLREEVREARKTRDYVKNIAERMLDTLKAMAIGRLTSGSLRDESVRTSFVEHTDQRGG